MGVARIEAITPSIVAPTYDLEVAEAHSFVVNGVLVHNSRVTQKYPSVYLMEPGARGEILSVAFAGDGQHQDTGGKLIFAAPYTTGRITSKSISKGTGTRELPRAGAGAGRRAPRQMQCGVRRAAAG
jgi:Fe-S cluster assembly scaffold protein SufB